MNMILISLDERSFVNCYGDIARKRLEMGNDSSEL